MSHHVNYQVGETVVVDYPNQNSFWRYTILEVGRRYATVIPSKILRLDPDAANDTKELEKIDLQSHTLKNKNGSVGDVYQNQEQAVAKIDEANALKLKLQEVGLTNDFSNLIYLAFHHKEELDKEDKEKSLKAIEQLEKFLEQQKVKLQS